MQQFRTDEHEGTYIKNLCIEITRRCNMRCAHCMQRDTGPQSIMPNEMTISKSRVIFNPAMRTDRIITFS